MLTSRRDASTARRRRQTAPLPPGRAYLQQAAAVAAGLRAAALLAVQHEQRVGAPISVDIGREGLLEPADILTTPQDFIVRSGDGVDIVRPTAGKLRDGFTDKLVRGHIPQVTGRLIDPQVAAFRVFQNHGVGDGIEHLLQLGLAFTPCFLRPLTLVMS